MPYRITPLINNQLYHVFNRGVEKRNVFIDRREHIRFLETTKYYQQLNPKTKFSQANQDEKEKEPQIKLVEILAYCLMPNHFHFLLQQLQDNGISIFIRRLINSYTRYFNTKNDRIGPLFQGPFKAIRVESDEHLLNLTRYIHLNPLVGYIVEDLQNFEWSSYQLYINARLSSKQICKRENIEKFISLAEYEQFVQNQVDYVKQLGNIKHLTLDLEE